MNHAMPDRRKYVQVQDVISYFARPLVFKNLILGVKQTPSHPVLLEYLFFVRRHDRAHMKKNKQRNAWMLKSEDRCNSLP
jgi:hypothetical protein